ncbi:MAG: ABC transporter substrate-binding protein [bacterium]|jgi:polar amino acid transport system substrate-binding protein
MKKTKFGAALTGVICLVLAITVLAGCGGTEKTALETIKEKGVMTVGTSADYPPFEFVDEDGNYAGFDIELIKAIGEKMGVEVKIEDMTFDTLITALQQGKIDAVIACMSPTPDRLLEADFTDPYYQTVNAVLAKKGAAVTVGEPADLTAYVIGVQTGTTHDEWATGALLETGQITEEKYFRYQRVDQGVMDLVNGRIDVFITDLPPAEDLAAVQPVEIVFSGELNPDENPGVAVAKGNADLVAEINKVIEELKADGFIGALAEQYLAEE